ncbi:hypothetical protein LDENG_00163050 [Lucifuga dentata]|nr:hypothetical protein LDENG_00163050 [Lucifuga dentata]
MCPTSGIRSLCINFPSVPTLCNIASLCPSLSQHSTEVLIHARVTSPIDYCNAILSGIPDKLLQIILQIIQNSAARIITRTKSSNHITPILIQLHWLPVHQQIHYKILLLTFKALHNMASPYLSERLRPYTPSRSLRSSTAALLSVPAFRLSTMGARAFSSLHPDYGTHFLHTSIS